MKIVKQDQLIINDGYSYYRREYTDNSFEWLSFDKQDTLFTIKDDDDFEDFDLEKLEKKYQKLINKPSTTTNEQPQVLLKIICKNPKGCACDTWAFIKKCEHSVEEISDSSNLWMIDGEDREG